MTSTDNTPAQVADNLFETAFGWRPSGTRPASIQAPEGSDLAAAAAAEQDAWQRADLAETALDAAREAFNIAQAAYDAASEEAMAASDAIHVTRRAHIAAMRAAGVAQTADGYVTR